MTETVLTPRILVMGGGVCGLYGALEGLKLGYEVTVIEKEAQLGGLAAGHKRGENWYDLGVHMLHAFDEEVFSTCKNALGEERIEVPLKAHIQWLGKQYHYPLRGRDIIMGLPPAKLFRCVAGLFLAELRNKFSQGEQGDDAESALIELYGEPLYEFFFEGFTHRYWGIHPSELSAEFVRRKMPRLSAVDVLKNILMWLKISTPKDAQEGALRFETLHYSKTGAETLPRRLGEKIKGAGGQLKRDSPVEHVFHNGERITGVQLSGKETLGQVDDVFLSTIPLPELIQRLSPPPPTAVLNAASHLLYKPMIVYALLVKKERCMDALYTYYRDHIFHRVGEPKNAGLTVTPEGHTTLIVELTCEVGDEKWNDERFPDVITGLEKEGLCVEEEIIEKHLLTSRHAYPIFKRGFESHLSVVQEYLAQFSNLRSVGRQGAFSYPNMHSAMRMGLEGVRDLVQRR